MRRPGTACVIALLFSCGSRGGDHFQRLAQRANPVIERIREPVGVVLDPAQSDVKAIRSACLRAIADAAALSSAGFNDSSARVNNRSATQITLGVEDVLYTFSMQKDVMCREDEGDGSRDATCRKWCVENFTALADALDRARSVAAKENVTLQPLRK